MANYVEGHARATPAQIDYIHGLYRRVHGHAPGADDVAFWRRMTRRRAGEIVDALKLEEEALPAEVRIQRSAVKETPTQQQRSRFADILADPRK